MRVHGVLLLVPYPREFQVTPLALPVVLWLVGADGYSFITQEWKLTQFLSLYNGL